MSFRNGGKDVDSCFLHRRCRLLHFQALSPFAVKKLGIDESEVYTFEGIRNSLIRQEDSIIFAVLERAQLCCNAEMYNPNAFPVKGYTGSMLEYMIKETEKLHAAVGRTTSKPCNLPTFKLYRTVTHIYDYLLGHPKIGFFL